MSEAIEEQMHSPAWSGWVVIAVTAGACAALGHVAARLAGFPYYPGYQGVLVQQPLAVAVASAVAMVICVAVALRLAAVLTRPMDSRLGAALAMLSLAGFAARGGSMGGVMRAGDGRQLYWLLALELLGLAILLWGCFALRYRAASLVKPQAKQGVDTVAALVQGVLFGLLCLIFARSTVKAQSMGSVLAAGIAATLLTHMIIGRTWRGSWCLPVVVGLVGYVINALTATGIDTGVVQSYADGLGRISPLDYLSMGPAGLVVGELMHGEESAAALAPRS